MMSKQCRNCGAELPDDAAFCPHCTQVQQEKAYRRPPRRWRKYLLLGVLAALLLAAAAAFVLLRHRPQVCEGGAEVVYTDGGVYHVLLTFSANGGVMTVAEPQIGVALPSGMESALPSQLYVWREDTADEVWEEFLDKVESSRVETVPLQGGGTMTAAEPVHHADFPHAALQSDVIYTSESGSNEVLWTLNMKNGDTILLRQRIDASAQDTVCYDPQTAPMDTAAELQAQLDTVAAEVSADTIVDLYLPPVTYDEPIRFDGPAFRVYGGSDGTHETTFAAPVTLRAVNPIFTEFFGVCFAGSGDVGLTALSSAVLHGYTVTGWDTGVCARDAWVCVKGCSFADNAAGLMFDSMGYTSSDAFFVDNQFRDNETAVSIRRLAGDVVLDFSGTAFSGNGTDLENPASHPTDLSGAIFE